MPWGDLSLPYQERIEDKTFRLTVELLDPGDTELLRRYLVEHPGLVEQRVIFEGGNYFQNPALLEFVAENPIRHGTLPANIVEVAKVILDAEAGRDESALDATLGLVCSGCVTRECHVQGALIDLLCDYGANPQSAMLPALAHGEFEAVENLLRRGAPVDLVAAAALGRVEDARRQLSCASAEDRHRALALASQFGHAVVVRLLLDAGEDANRYNPAGCHSYFFPLHQAASGGHEETVRLLVERVAHLDTKDTLWQATPAGWARHAGMKQIQHYLTSTP